MKVKIKKLHHNAKTPTYATDGSACFDLYAHTVGGMTTMGKNVENGYPLVCGTGLAFEIPPGHAMMIYSRSGHGFKDGVRLANCVGVIDCDFRGEVMVKLTADFDAQADSRNTPPFFVRTGDRIAQARIVVSPQVGFEVVDELSSTERGAGGFGSSGV